MVALRALRDPTQRESHARKRWSRVRANSGRYPLKTMTDSSATSGPRELPHLATFARAAERGSFTDSAADLGVSQAAVSQRIAALESELRVSLFDRRGGRIALTEAGERLYALAGKILGLHEEARLSV